MAEILQQLPYLPILKIDHLTIIPEIRIDNGNQNLFAKSDVIMAKSTSSFIVAAY